MPTERVLADFAGTWQLNREIEPVAGPAAQFVGEAVFKPCDAGLAYLESGMMTVAGAAPMKAERRYVWQHDLSVLFEDGRFFHQVPAAGGATAHWCDPDQYDGYYDFSDWPAFSVTWTVRGPRKDYRMISHYCR